VNIVGDIAANRYAFTFDFFVFSFCDFIYAMVGFAGNG